MSILDLTKEQRAEWFEIEYSRARHPSNQDSTLLGRLKDLEDFVKWYKSEDFS
jgi:hypothetical protein